MLRKLLIANRGEIACRIARTARRMGIVTVAMHSDADRHALHVRATDEAVEIGPAEAARSYLNIEAIVAAAKATDADAVHPGYGFLSENADFADAAAAAGLIFVGPPATAIRAMGSKSASKALMGKAGVPLIPGYHGDAQDDATLAREATKIGFPVLVKASAGGGGRGMRVVESAGELAEALTSARREAQAAFGDGTLLLEKYLTRARHVEAQIFADRHGNCVHLFERDCSLQRRHQKVIEEAPAPGMSADLRGRMGSAAVAAARAVDYVGAGTVEFLLDASGAFYFMEMNTRLQVEHPVTEMIVGHDLVEWQLRVAGGEPLPARQQDLKIDGHAIEARVYAEDPAREFLPAAGRIGYVRLPAEDMHVRIDAGVAEGDTVGIHYDPLLAKLIVWDRDRKKAVARLADALAATRVGGIVTNRDFLLAAARHPEFVAGPIDIGFLDRRREELLPPKGEAPTEAFALAVLETLVAAAERARLFQPRDPHSPWAQADGWRMEGVGRQVLRFVDSGKERAIPVCFARDGWTLEFSEVAMPATARRSPDGGLEGMLDGTAISGHVMRVGAEVWVFCRGRTHRLRAVDPGAAATHALVGGSRLTAPMPGRVVAVPVIAGTAVDRGQILMVLEAMKMEHAVHAPANGIVRALHFAVGDTVEEGAALVSFEAAGDKEAG